MTNSHRRCFLLEKNAKLLNNNFLCFNSPSENSQISIKKFSILRLKTLI